MDRKELYQQSKEKGLEGEEKFQHWMDERGVPFIRIDSARGTLSKALKETMQSKRPDFILFVKNIGAIFVDVKNRKIEDGCFTIDNENDLEKLAHLEETTPVKMYIVVPNREDDMQTWYWFHASSIYEKYGKHDNHRKIKIPFDEHFTTGPDSTFEDIIKQIALQ